MSAPSPSCPDDAAARRLARSMAVVSAFCLTGDTMLYIALPLFWQECGLTALWQVGVLLAVNRLVRLPLNPLVRLLYTRIDQHTGMALAVVLARLDHPAVRRGPVLCALAAAALPLGPGLDAPAPRLPVRPDGGLPQGQSRLSHGQLQRPRAPGQPAGHDRRRPPGRSAGLLHRGPALRRPDADGPAAGPEPHPPQRPRHRSGEPGRHVPAFGPAPAPPRHAACLHHRTAGGPGLPGHLRRHPQPHGGPARGRAGPCRRPRHRLRHPGRHVAGPALALGTVAGAVVRPPFRRPARPGPVLCACLGGGACALALVALYLPAPLWLPLLLCSQLCATAWPPSPMPPPRIRPNGTAIPRIRWPPMPSSWIAARLRARYWPTACRTSGAWMLPYLAAAALLLCLLPLWMRREAA